MCLCWHWVVCILAISSVLGCQSVTVQPLQPPAAEGAVPGDVMPGTGSVKVFYHVAAMLHYKTVVKDHLSRLMMSTLYDHIEGIYCFLLAADSARDEAQQLLQAFGSKVHIAATSSDTQQAERFTLLGLRRLLSPDDRLLYMHSKGISYDPTSELGGRIYWWTLYMQWHLIKHARRCLELMEQGYDVVGVNYFQPGHGSSVRPHFSGNFWWAHARYVLQLNSTMEGGYLGPEFYIMSGSPKHTSLWQSDNDMYLSEYPPRLYIDPGSA